MINMKFRVFVNDLEYLSKEMQNSAVLDISSKSATKQYIIEINTLEELIGICKLTKVITIELRYLNEILDITFDYLDD